MLVGNFAESIEEKWWPLSDLNTGPTDYESGALTN